MPLDVFTLGWLAQSLRAEAAKVRSLDHDLPPSEAVEAALEELRDRAAELAQTITAYLEPR